MLNNSSNLQQSQKDLDLMKALKEANKMLRLHKLHI